MFQFITLPLVLCTTGLLSETLCSLTLEVEVGDKVTIWCQRDLTITGSLIFWYKHSSDSVPLLIGCKQPFPVQKCYFFTESERIVISVHERNTSLTITAVNVSDTGLYYCSFRKLDEMIFSNSTTSLHVKGGNKMLSKNSEGRIESQGLSFLYSIKNSPAVFFTLTVVFGAATLILLSILIFIIVKQRTKHTGDIAVGHGDEEQETDAVNYAALNFTKRKTKKTERQSETMDPHVVYSTIKQ